MKESFGNEPPNPEVLRKTKYFSDFAKAHFSEMKILEKGGVLGKGNEEWRNISEHCLVEAVGADILAEHLGADRQKLITAALLHDWYKRKEIESMKKVGGGLGYATTVEEDKESLKNLGVSSELIELAHANIPKSIEGEYVQERTIEEKVMHFIDAVTDGTDFIDYKKRMELSGSKKANREFSESLKDRYQGKSLLEVQNILAGQEQAEFEKALHIPPGTILAFIKEKLTERIAKK